MDNEIYEIIARKISDLNLNLNEIQTLNKWISESEENQKIYNKLLLLQKPVSLISEKGGIKYDVAYKELTLKIGKIQSAKSIKNLIYYAASIIVVIGMTLFIWLNFNTENAIVRLSENNNSVLLKTPQGNVIELNYEKEIIILDSLYSIKNQDLTLSYLDLPETENIEYNTLTVPYGAEYQVKLNDGTLVYINSGSELTFPVAFGREKREIFLKGEAWFDVAVDNTRDFVVYTEDLNIKVTGTSFNVKAYSQFDQNVTTLVTGSIEIECNDSIYLVCPGQQFTYSKADEQTHLIEVDTELFTSWKEGYYKFKQTRLEEILNTLALWYDLKISYIDEKVKDILFTGKLNRDSMPENLFAPLLETNDIEIIIKDKTIIVMKK